MIEIKRFGGHLGADVHGVDLSQPLSEAETETIREAHREHLVLFFREQKLLSFDEHKALASQFGELEVTTYKRKDIDDVVQILEGGVEGSEADSWLPTFHCDSSFRDNRPLGSFLQAHTLPKCGGTTAYSSMYAAYDELSAPMRGFLDTLDAFHSVGHMHKRLAGKPGFTLRLDPDEVPLKTPVVRTHPETGRKFLNVNMIYTSHIDGMREDESEVLLRFLFDHIRRPEFEVRLYWNEGDIAFWDNYACQHCGVPDFSGYRKMQRISVLRPDANEGVAAEAA
ncbi:MAG: TauD/TfdA family dioxygenase [Novosphingobium sp.]|nr:TauD/TfdA family dioxygenase [Novosphingobium sp.]